MSGPPPKIKTTRSTIGRLAGFCFRAAQAFGRRKIRSTQTTSLKASMPLLLANGIETMAALVRNVALAHLIAPTEFGLAISLSALIGVLELVTDFGVPVYAVRKSITLADGVIMATAQSVALIRAACLAVILIAVAPLFAQLFGVSHDRQAYYFLAFIAFGRGLENLGVKAMTREFRFGREAAVLMVSQIGGLIATVAMAVQLRDFRCILGGLATMTTITVVLSNVLSLTPYRLGWHKKAVRDIASFGAPLLVNGMAVAFCLSDRLLIGGFLDPSALAFYNVSVGTAQSPRGIAIKFLTSVFVPAFVRERHDFLLSRELFYRWTWILSALAFLYGICLALYGRELLLMIFGESYAPSREFMALTGMSIFAAFMMHLPVPPAYSYGDTKVITAGSLIYAAAMLPALVVLLYTRSLTSFILTLTLSELAGVFALIRIFRRRHPLFRPDLVNAFLLPYAILAMLAVIAHVCPAAAGIRWLLVSLGFAGCGSLLYVSKLCRLRQAFPDCRSEVSLRERGAP